MRNALNAQKVVQGAKIFEKELGGESTNEMRNKPLLSTCDNVIIHIYKSINVSTTLGVEK